MNPKPQHDALRANLLSVAYRILADLHTAHWPDEHLYTLASDHRLQVQITIMPAVQRQDRASIDRLNMTRSPELSELEKEILAACTKTGQTAKRLANRCKRKCNSHFRAALASLCRQGILVRTSNGYSLM